MAYNVELKPSAARSLSKLPREIQKNIAAHIDGLSQDPRPRGCKKLETEQDLYRIRAGDYRILYQVHDRIVLVIVVAIGHRRDVYRKK